MTPRELSAKAGRLGINMKCLLAMANIDSSTYYKWARGELQTLQGHVGKLKKMYDYLILVEEAQKVFK